MIQLLTRRQIIWKKNQNSLQLFVSNTCNVILRNMSLGLSPSPLYQLLPPLPPLQIFYQFSMIPRVNASLPSFHSSITIIHKTKFANLKRNSMHSIIHLKFRKVYLLNIQYWFIKWYPSVDLYLIIVSVPFQEVNVVSIYTIH